MTEQGGLTFISWMIRIPIRLQRRGGRKQKPHDAGGSGGAGTGAEPRRDVVKALVRAHRWRRKDRGAVRRSRSPTLRSRRASRYPYVCRLLSLTCFAPYIFRKRSWTGGSQGGSSLLGMP